MITKLPQKNISEDWTHNTLGDVLEKMEGGGTPSKDRVDFWNGSIPWASVKDVVTHNPNDTQDHISDAGLRNSSSRIVPQGTLIVPTRMALGHAVVFNVDVSINQDLKALYPKESLKNEYLYYWFQSKRSFIERLGSGSTVSGIQQNELKSIKFDLPPLPEQRRIVVVLETWDKAIEKLSQKIERKKNIKKGLMQELLTGKTRLQDFKIMWKHHRLGDISTMITKGTTPTTNGFSYQESGVRFIKIESIAEDGVLIERKCAYISQDAHKSLNRSQLKEGDILFSIAGALGRMYMVDKKNLPANTNQALAIIRLNESKGILKDFVFLYLQSKRIKTWIREINVQMAQANISLGDISNLKIEVPALEEQKAIVDILMTSDTEIKCLEYKLRALQEQKRYLLNNLITGTIRTPETLSIHT